MWGIPPLLRRLPLANDCISRSKKKTSKQVVAQNTTNHQQPATRSRDRERVKQNPLNRAAESAASRILIDVVLLLGDAAASAMLLQHLQISHLRIANRTLGGTDHASPERHLSDRAAGVHCRGVGRGRWARKRADSSAGARRFAGRAVPRRGSNIGSASHAVRCTPGDGDAAPHARSFPCET